MANSGWSSCVARSPSTMTGMPRTRAASQMGCTKSGKRLSAITTSGSTTSACGSLGRAAASLSPGRVATIFSPAPSMKMPETETEPPSTRSTPLTSMPACARPARMRRLASSVPTGPAKHAIPPRRATARAALAAQPPVMARSDCAWIFSPGAGKCSTSKMKSSTAMPAQSTTGRAPALLLRKGNTVLHPGPDDVIGDGDRLWCGKAVGMLSRQHECHFFALEPAGVVELRAVDDDLARERLGMAADHQRGRERPRLRGEICNPPAKDAGFLARFAPHGILDRLAWLDVASETRPHARLETMRAAEHAAFAIDRQHDGDRIGAGEMLQRASWTVASPARVDGLCRCAAIRAEPMPRMPVEQRLAFRQRRQMLGVEQSAHRNRTQIDDGEVVV